MYGVALTETNDFLQDVSLQVFAMVGLTHERWQQILMSLNLDLSESKKSIKTKVPTSTVSGRLQEENRI